MREPYIIAPPVQPMSCAAAVDLIATRFEVRECSGAVVWSPDGDGAASLLTTLAEWIEGGRRIVVDPADPLSFLLTECRCEPRANQRVRARCPVHRAWPTSRSRARRRRTARSTTGGKAE